MKEIGLLTIATAGNVDDGKSTLIGRLFYDSKQIFDDQLESIKLISKQKGSDLDLSFLVDGLKAEREQGITIDVAYRYFSTPQRKFIIVDTPGHIQYTRNMVTGMSNANLAILLIDATKGITEQTKRHAFIISLLQVPHIVLCINKMDLVNYSQQIFQKIKEEFEGFSSKLDIQDMHFTPISALYGDNIVSKSNNMLWYEGPSLLYLLENIYISSDYNLRDYRFPVQMVIKPFDQDYRAYAGRIAGGIFKQGDRVRVLPSGFETKIVSIDTFNGKIQEATPKMSVSLILQDNLDISRGDMMVGINNIPIISQDIDLMLCWLNQKNLNIKRKYVVRHTTKMVRCIIDRVYYKIDINTLHKDEIDKEIRLNDIARIKIRTTNPLFYDSYKKNKITGSLILIDETTHETVAAGMIR